MTRDTNGARTERVLVRATAREGRVRAISVDTTEIVAELRRIHGTDPAVTAALGRTVTGALLLSALLKEERHSVTLRIQGDGPAGTLIASANGAGEVRGLVGNPRPDVEQARDGKLNVSGVVGRTGRLAVTRDLGLRQPYIGTVELVSGEIGDDLAHYLARSEQVPSAVGIGVYVQADGSVEAAGGYMVQLLPEADDTDADAVETAVRALPHPTVMLREGDTPEKMLARIFPEGYDLLARTGVRFRCTCSRERAEKALILLGADELEAMRAENRDTGHSEIVCEFCKTAYRFTDEEVDGLIEAAG